jgi:hypothetical protein
MMACFQDLALYKERAVCIVVNSTDVSPSLDQFRAWNLAGEFSGPTYGYHINPSNSRLVGNDECANLWLDYAYCVAA